MQGSWGERWVKQNHKMWVDEELAAGRKQREEKWTKSVAVGSKEFVESVQNNLGGRAKEPIIPFWGPKKVI